MKKTKLEKGITLIALIITIVVLLILAGVAIATVQESDIIAHAENATSTYKTKADEENTILEGYLATIEENMPGESTPEEEEEILWVYEKDYYGDTDLGFIGNVKELVLDEDREVKAYVGIYNEEIDEFECDENSEVITKKFSEVDGVLIESSASVENLTLGKIASAGKVGAFMDTKIKNLTILGNYTDMPTHFFEANKYLETVVINEGVTKINGSAFYGCSALKSITIPSTVTSILDLGGDCTTLTSVKINKTADEIKAMTNYPWKVSGKIYDKDNNLVL